MWQGLKEEQKEGGNRRMNGGQLLRAKHFQSETKRLRTVLS